MTNDQLDQRVAKLLGWDEKSRNGVDYWVAKDGVRQYRADGWSPSTNLTQAMGLWDEARPNGEVLCVQQYSDNTWSARTLNDVLAGNDPKDVPFTNLPRAVTEAWCEAMEQEGKR